MWSIEAPRAVNEQKYGPDCYFWIRNGANCNVWGICLFDIIFLDILFMGQRARNTKRVQGGSPRTGIGKTIEKNGIFSLEMVQSCFSLKWHLGPFSSPITARDAHHGPFLQSYRCSITGIALTTYVVKKSHHEELCIFMCDFAVFANFSISWCICRVSASFWEIPSIIWLYQPITAAPW